MAMKLTEKDRRILDLIKDGGSVPATARSLGIPQRTVYNAVTKLTSMQYLRLIPGTRSPAMYEAGERYLAETEARRSRQPFGLAKDGAVVENDATLPANGTRLHPTYPFPDSIPGVSSGKVCPEGYVEAHLNGAMSLTVEQVGTFEDPNINGIGYVGYWKDPYRNKGSVNWPGQICIDGQLVTFIFRQGAKGSQTFSLRPKRIFVDPAQYQSVDQIKELFVWRALRVATILAGTGWRLSNPKIDSLTDVEVAIQNSPLAQFIPQGHNGDSDIFVDGSPGCPEAEMSHITEWEKVQIFADLPSHVMEAKSMARAADDKAEAVRSEASARLDGLEGLLDRMISVQERTEAAILGNTENIARISQFDAQVAELMMRRQANEYIAPGSLDDRARMVGYQ